MAQDFPGLPDNIYEYENRFNYSVWTPNTTILMCNVPWDSSYRDVVRFDTDEERNAYFASRSADGYAFTLNGLVYLRYGEPVRVNAPFDMVTRCNYMVVKNPLQPVPPTDGRQPDVFYYFINDAKYIAPNTTQVNVQLDVWLTYYDRIEFNMCYVNKGHIGIANENSTVDNLADYLTDTEGLNIGDEYEIVHQEFVNFQEEEPWVVVVCTAMLGADPGSVSDPNLYTSRGSQNSGMPSSSDVYAMTVDNFMKFMEKISDAPWVSQCVQMITVVPKMFANVDEHLPAEIMGANAFRISPSVGSEQPVVVDVDFFEQFQIPSRYANLLKFYTSPYCMVEMTCFTGGELVLKPECVGLGRGTAATGEHRMHIEVDVMNNAPDIRAYVYPMYYNGRQRSSDDVGVDYVDGNANPNFNLIRGGENIDFAIVLDNFPQLSIVNDMYLYYMASTVNSRNYAFASADWSQQKALTAARLSFDQSGANMQNSWANQQLANNANWTLSGISQEKNMWNGASSAISSGVGALGNLASGNFGGAAADAANIGLSAANTALNADWINRTTSAQIGAATATTQNNIGLQGYMRDTNYDYAMYAATGDYETAIQGIQAKVQDARLTQPSTSGQNGGNAFNIAAGFSGILVKWKRLKGNFMRQVGDFWLRYGYYVNRWLTPPADLKCMENFTYWKMQSVSLSASEVPELFKETIRGIFEKGVTVWSDPDKMYRIDLADNDAVKGVRY